MKRREKRTEQEIIDAVVSAIKNNGELTRREIDFHVDYPRTAENHLRMLRSRRIVHIARWEVRNVPGRYEALFGIGDKPDAKRPSKYDAALPQPSSPDRRAIYFDESEVLMDKKYQKQYKQPQNRVHVGWLGSI